MRITQDRGFTLVELLMVMLIIGILAGIAVPQMLGQKRKADNAVVKSGLVAGAKALDEIVMDRETFAVTLDELRSYQPSLVGLTGLALDADADHYSLTAESDSGITFEIKRVQGGPIGRDCAPAGQSGCLAAADAAGNRW